MGNLMNMFRWLTGLEQLEKEYEEQLKRQKRDFKEQLKRQKRDFEEQSERKDMEHKRQLERQKRDFQEQKERQKRDFEDELNQVPLDEPWIFKNGIFSKETKDNFFESILNTTATSACNINLVVIGAVGSGKSSLVNTMKTVFRDSEEISTIASVYGIEHGSITKKFHQVVLKTLQNGKQLLIHDTRGIHAETEIMLADIKDVIGGHVRKDYEFSKTPVADLRNMVDSPYIANPTLDQKMHCVLIVIDVNNVDKNGDIEEIERLPLRSVISHLHSENIPFRLVLTKLDIQLDQEFLSAHNYDMGCIIKSRHARKQYEQAKSKFDMQNSQVLPVINYTKEYERNVVLDVFALAAMKNIVQEATSYIENNM